MEMRTAEQNEIVLYLIKLIIGLAK